MNISSEIKPFKWIKMTQSLQACLPTSSQFVSWNNFSTSKVAVLEMQLQSNGQIAFPSSCE